MIILTELPSSPKKAKEIGSKYYYTGIPCKNNHITYRYTFSASCSECSRVKSLERSRLPHVKKMNAYNSKKESSIARQKEYYKRPEVRERIRKRRSNKEAREKRNARERELYNPEKAKEYRDRNKERLQTYFKEYYRKNREKCLEGVKLRYKSMSDDDREKLRNYKVSWQREFSQRPEGKASIFMRKSLYRCISFKRNRTSSILGYSRDELVSCIDRQFQSGMSWSNHGDWHIDHIIPIKWFLENGITDPKVINALSNLRPLWKEENLSKGSIRMHLL